MSVIVKHLFLLPVLFLVACISPGRSQNAFFDAKYFQSRRNDFKQLDQTVEQLKRQAREQLGQDAANRNLLFYNRRMEDMLQNFRRFYKNPFDPAIRLPLSQEQLNRLLTPDPALGLRISFPFLDPENEAILDGQSGEPLYFFSGETDAFFPKEPPDAPELTLWEPDAAFQDPFIPAEEEELWALFDPRTGNIHLRDSLFFNPEPSARFHAVRRKFYANESDTDPQPQYDVADNEAYTQDNAILVLFRNTSNDSIRLALLGYNFAGGDDLGVDKSLVEEFDLAAAPAALIGEGAALASPGGLSTMAIDAIARFLVDRTRAELVLAFYEDFKAKMDQSTELRTIFPNTYFLLTNKDILRVPSLGKVWVETFQGDLQNLIPNFEELLLVDPDYADLKEKTEFKVFRIALQLIDGSRTGLSAFDNLAIIDQRLGGVQDPVGQSVRILRYLTDNLRDRQDGGASLSGNFLSLDQWRTISTDESKLLTGLLYQGEKLTLDAVKLKDGKTLGGAMAQYPDQFSQSLYQLLQLLHQQKEVQDQVVEAFQNPDPEETWNNFSMLSHHLLDLMDFGFRLRYFANPDGYLADDFYRLYQPVARNTFDAVTYLQQKAYGSFLTHGLKVVEPIMQYKIDELDEQIAALEDQYLKASPAQRPQIKTQLNPLRTRRAVLANVIRQVLFYGSFMIDVLSAQDAETIHAILHQYALPVGSYQLKRVSAFSLNINAYPGLYVGLESGDDKTLATAGVTGVTAPLGLALNWGHRALFGTPAEGYSFSLFVPVIDVGAAFSYRWSNAGGGFPEELKWRQVLSPGLYLATGLKRVPISLMAGMQYTPALRKINGGFADFQANAFRFGLNAAVDIPVFNLFLQEKRPVKLNKPKR